MKKSAKILVAVLTLTLVLITSSFALEWVFDNDATVKQWSYNQMNAALTSDGVSFTMTGNDVFMTHNLSAAEKLKTAEYPYVAMVMKINSTVNYGGIFFKTDEAASMGDNYSQFSIPSHDGNWDSYIIDMTTFAHNNWKGTLDVFRIDLINAADLDAKITVRRVGIFKTRAEAQAFIDADPIMADAAKKKAEEEAAKADEYAKMESPTFIFDNFDAINAWNTSGATTTFKFGYLCLVPLHNDPIITFTPETPFPASEFKYFAIRTKAISTFLYGSFFFSNDVYNNFSDKSYLSYPLTYNEWTNTIINMEEKLPERWVGLVNKIRIDPINPPFYDQGAEIYLDRMGFFRTEEEAGEFLNGGRTAFDYSEESIITKETCKIIIPANSITEDYDPADYEIKNSVDLAKTDDAIVLYTDASGNESPVALSYVNGAGYASYVAKKSGTYNIGYNAKSFVDTDGHWASDNIKFVANRSLFGGTSQTEFSPDMTMTRGMFITVLGRMHGVDTSAYDGNTGFADVNSTEYYAPYIQWAVENKLALPISEGAFAPEEPITRKDMALITSNYMKAFNYNIKLLDSSDFESFTDLDGFTDDEKNAIIFVQKAGIINGKGDNKFDPNGISTRAEVATVMQRVVKSILKANILSGKYDSDYFNRDRIRTSTWSYYLEPNKNDNFKVLAEAGFDTIVSMSGVSDETYSMADMYGIQMFTGTMPTKKGDTTSDPVFMNAAYYDHPSFGGSYLGDEPGTTEYDYLSEHANSYIEKMPGKIPFLNLLPMYANAAQLKYNAGAAAIEYYDADPDLYRKYCDEYCEKFNTNYICVDIYPLHATSTYQDYVESVNQVASSARRYGKEFWCCLQAHSFNPSKRTPSLNDYSWQCYTLLSFGCKNLIWWYYEGNTQTPSLIDMNTMEPTQAYYDTQTMIAEIKAISDTYIQYKNLGAFTLNCTAATPYLKMSNEYKDFAVISEITCDQPLLVGCFDKKEGEGYAFTVVNMSELLQKKSATVKFKLNGDYTVTSYQGGNVTVLTPANGYYTVNLDWGMGAFFTIA